MRRTEDDNDQSVFIESAGRTYTCTGVPSTWVYTSGPFGARHRSKLLFGWMLTLLTTGLGGNEPTDVSTHC